MVWYNGAEVSTVGVPVIAGVGGCWCHPCPKAATLATYSLYLWLPAPGLGQLSTVAEEVCAGAGGRATAGGGGLHCGGGGGCGGGTGRPTSLGTTKKYSTMTIKENSTFPCT